ncbi:MAG: M28 family metallopeptidase, partial [Gemmatimonadota bacterium]
NNDMIGNIEGVNGVVDNTTARVFSDGTPPTETEQERNARRFTGGEVDGISRQLARYVDGIADRYVTNLDVMMVYRLDRFGRGGHHTPFADQGYPAVRIMETNENYVRQHQDIRVEDGIAYGDVLEGVDFRYAAKLTALNAATLAALAAAPGPPQDVRICGAVEPSARLAWAPPTDGSNVAGYRVYWRLTDAPTWSDSRWVANVSAYTFDGLIIDNYFFGVAAVGHDGNESVVVFPRRARRGEGC